MKYQVERISTVFCVFALQLAMVPLVFAAESNIDDMWAASPHANAKSESFVHWDDEGMIPANCATCHSGTGFRDFLGDDGSQAGVTDKDHAPGSLVDCQTCHNDTVKELSSVKFPSGVVKENLGNSAQCIVCHQGRSSTKSVNDKIADLAQDTVSEDISFINIHYRAAAASLYGGEVAGGYQYEDHSYVGRFKHVAGFDTCTSCHNAHTTVVEITQCATCHAGNDELSSIRISNTDFDGDGNKQEGIAAEIDALHEILGAAILEYGSQIVKAPIGYKVGQYPYFFYDKNANNQIDDSEGIYPNRYQSWTPRLVRAAYNYQFVLVDPGAYAHNPKYALQLLYDSISDLKTKIDIDMGDIVRP